MKVCFRCNGMKKVYKLGQGYSHTNYGGEQVDCPLCLGEGKIKPLEEASKEIKAEVKKKQKEECKKIERNYKKKVEDNGTTL